MRIFHGARKLDRVSLRRDHLARREYMPVTTARSSCSPIGASDQQSFGRVL
jgi:hypothetical protein